MQTILGLPSLLPRAAGGDFGIAVFAHYSFSKKSKGVMQGLQRSIGRRLVHSQPASVVYEACVGNLKVTWQKKGFLEEEKKIVRKLKDTDLKFRQSSGTLILCLKFDGGCFSLMRNTVAAAGVGPSGTAAASIAQSPASSSAFFSAASSAASTESAAAAAAASPARSSAAGAAAGGGVEEEESLGLGFGGVELLLLLVFIGGGILKKVGVFREWEGLRSFIATGERGGQEPMWDLESGRAVFCFYSCRRCPKSLASPFSEERDDEGVLRIGLLMGLRPKDEVWEVLGLVDGSWAFE